MTASPMARRKALLLAPVTLDRVEGVEGVDEHDPVWQRTFQCLHVVLSCCAFML